MRAQVIASKGILVSDPTLQDMTPTRWMFEYAGLISNREHTWRTAVKTVHDGVVHYLGLDTIAPTKDPETGDLSKPPIDYLPLVAFINPRMYSDIMEKKVEYDKQVKALEANESTVHAMGYDEMVNRIDDLIPIFDEIFEGADEKIYNDALQKAIKTGVIAQDAPDPVTGMVKPPVKEVVSKSKKPKRKVTVK